MSSYQVYGGVSYKLCEITAWHSILSVNERIPRVRGPRYCPPNAPGRLCPHSSSAWSRPRHPPSLCSAVPYLQLSPPSTPGSGGEPTLSPQPHRSPPDATLASWPDGFALSCVVRGSLFHPRWKSSSLEQSPGLFLSEEPWLPVLSCLHPETSSSSPRGSGRVRGRPRTFLKARHRVSALPRREVRAGGAGCQLDGRHGRNNGWRLGLPFLGWIQGVSSCPLRSLQEDPRPDPSDRIRQGRSGGQPRQRSEVPWRGWGSGRGRPAQPFSTAGMDSSWPLL